MKFEVYDFLEKDYHKGSFISIKWKNEITLTNGETVVKMVKTVGRLGINYGCFNPDYKDNETWLVNHIIKSCKNGNKLLQVYTTSNIKPQVEYIKNGLSVKYEDIVDKMQEKDKLTYINKVFTVSLSKIISLGNFNIA